MSEVYPDSKDVKTVSGLDLAYPSVGGANQPEILKNRYNRYNHRLGEAILEASGVLDQSEAYRQQQDLDTIDSYEEEEIGPDYVDKAVSVPLPAGDMKTILSMIQQEYADGFEGKTEFHDDFVDSMVDRLRNIKEGELVTLDDLMYVVEARMGHHQRLDEVLGGIKNGEPPYYEQQHLIAETRALSKIMDDFTKYLDRIPKLKHLADNIDVYTTHPEVHDDHIRGDDTRGGGRYLVAPSESEDGVQTYLPKTGEANGVDTDNEGGAEGEDVKGADGKAIDVPMDARGLRRFERTHFENAEDESKESVFRQFVINKIQNVINEADRPEDEGGIPEGAKFVDTVAGVINYGEAWPYLHNMLKRRNSESEILKMFNGQQEFGHASFSSVAEELGIDLSVLKGKRGGYSEYYSVKFR